MFEQSFVAAERRRAWPVFAWSAAQLVVLSGALLAPLVWIETMPLLRNEGPPLPPPRASRGVKVVDAKRFVGAPAARIPRLPYAPPGHKYALAAMEAVRPWLYSPTLLNGDPVEVLTAIEVNSTLAR